MCRIKSDSQMSCRTGAAVLAVFCLLAGCGSNPVDYSASARIEYTIAGGLPATYEKTSIDEQGLVEFIHHSRGGEFVTHFQLSASQLDSLKAAFDQADFFSLKNDLDGE